MKVLHINQSDIGGGAGIAAFRIHEGLLARGIDSRLLVGKALTGSSRVAVVPRWRFVETQLFRITYLLGLNYVYHLTTFRLPKHPLFREADVVHFHNLHTGYFNYLALPSLTKRKPSVFTLHDMWSFTGHCSYSYDCDRWRFGCGKCPYPQQYPKILIDNSRLEWKLKKFAYRHSQMAIVTASRWLTEQARQSILNRFPIQYIPHGIDPEVYQPLDVEKCRSLLGIPRDKKVLMFGAVNLQDRRKGGDLLIQALKDLPASLKAEVLLLTLGYGGEAISEATDVAAWHLGYVTSDRMKAIAYSAANLFIFPSRADIFGLMLLESMACGTPIVSFNVGGIPDLVRHRLTGYLAEPEDDKDFSAGIMRLLEDEALRNRMSLACRKVVLEEFRLELQVKRYLDLYHHLLGVTGKCPASPAGLRGTL